MKQPSIENRDEGSGLYREYPLDYSQQQIRVLMLHPGAWDDQISCDFCIVSLNDQPAYLALSYVWGQDNPDCVATIGSHQIQIRHNLFSALRRLRAHATGEDTVIWVDAICIDQTSNVERSSQVALMGEIYHQCKAVQVWLGEIEFAHEFWSESPIIKNPGRCYDVGKIADRLKDPIKEEVKYTTPPWRRMTTHRFSGYLKILQDIPEWELLTRMAVFIQLTLRHPPAPVLVSLLNWAPTSGKKQVEHFYKAFQALFENQW
jgi:hypothetical protein